MSRLVNKYQAIVRDGGIRSDPAQIKAIRALEAFLERWSNGENAPPLRFIKRLLFRKNHVASVRGVYLYGGVGRGKTMLMDLLKDEAGVQGVRRVHFHEFMIDVHNRLKAIREALNKNEDETVDYIDALAQSIAHDTSLLCFDELHVDDITDAMILGPLFAGLFKYGTAVMATSNYAPDELYPGGLQRKRFLPFIALLKANMDIIHLDSDTDYRMQAIAESGVYFTPLSDLTWQGFDKLFTKLCEGRSVKAASIDVRGRALPVLQTDGQNAWLDFKTLCDEARGAEDYLTLANTYKTIFVDNIPRMDEDRRNQARRFMLLIDALYDAGCVVILRAACPVNDIYSGDTHQFEFERTLSRLIEMQSDKWLKTK